MPSASPRASASRKSSNGVRPLDQRLLERGERLRHADQHLFVVGGRRRAERALPAAGEVGFGAHDLRDRRRRHAHLARIEQRSEALRPQVVVRAVPAVPALAGDVDDGRRVAVERREPDRLRLAVGPVAARLVAARAGHELVRREPRVEEEPLAERDRVGVAGEPVRRIARRRGRPRSVREDLRDLLGREGDGRAVVAPGGRRERDERGEGDDGGRCRALHFSVSSAVTRSTRRPSPTSNTNCQRPGMWNIRPSARKRPGALAVTVGL